MNVVINLLITLGSLGIFLYGMKLMSESLQKLAGNKMRNILARMTSKPFNGILTGAFVTTVIQSSSATTVMVVSFVNAGLLSLAGAIAIIMGANIGTTATAWIISLLGLKFSMAQLAIPLVAFPAATSGSTSFGEGTQVQGHPRAEPFPRKGTGHPYLPLRNGYLYARWPRVPKL